jgi:hypothetical protein
MISHITSIFVFVENYVNENRLLGTAFFFFGIISYYMCTTLLGCALHCEWQHWQFQFRENLNLCGDMQTKKLFKFFPTITIEMGKKIMKFLVRCGGHTTPPVASSMVWSIYIQEYESRE